MNYTAPHAGAYEIYDRIADQYHVLIAGTTRSGKSVAENGIIYNIVNRMDPDEAWLYFIDPKLVELNKWRILPHVRDYADNPEDATKMLGRIVDKMMERYDYMQYHGQKTWNGSHVYIFIDEMADILDDGGKEFIQHLKKILRLGAAARIHIIGLSQFAKKSVIPAVVIDNFTCAIGLHMATNVASRQIIGKPGCEDLPLGGYAIAKWEDATYEHFRFPMYPETHYEAMRRYYSLQRFGTRKQ